MKIRIQKGFSLLEVSIALGLMSLGVMATIQMRTAQVQQDKARAVAQIYERFNNAAGTYMTLHHKSIIDKAQTNPECGIDKYEQPNEGMVITTNSDPFSSACKIILEVNGKAVEVANYLQPTPKELYNLNLLSNEGLIYDAQLPLPWNQVVVSRDTSKAPSGFGILIQLSCINSQSPLDATERSLGSCNSSSSENSTYDLRSLVYNIQPYSVEDLGGFFLERVRQAAGTGRTYLSDDTYSGALRSDDGTKLRNPLRSNASGKGVPHILAIRNGYGSSGLDAFVRRDGSTKLTDTWNVGNQEINGVKMLRSTDGVFEGSVSAGNATVSGELKAGSAVVDGNLQTNNAIVSGQLNAGSAIVTNGFSAGSGTFGALDSITAALTDALKATTAFISGTLKVAGLTTLSGGLNVAGGSTLAGGLNVTDKTNLAGELNVTGKTILTGEATVNGALTMNNTMTINGQSNIFGNAYLGGDTKVAKLRLDKEAKLGGDCNSEQETLGRAAFSSGGYSDTGLRLLVCDSSNKWVRAQDDYSEIISKVSAALATTNTNLGTTNTNLGTTNTNLATTNTNLATLSTNLAKTDSRVSDITKRVAKVENEYMNWDIININWDPARNITIKGQAETWLAKDKVWKRTPWKCNQLSGRDPAVDGQGNSGLPLWDSDNGVRWLKDASNIQKAVTGGSYTPPIFVGFDDVVNDNIVYDINCEMHRGERYWYVGVSAKKANEKNGNLCRSGLGSSIGQTGGPPAPSSLITPLQTYSGKGKCANFNLYAPNFAPQALAARFLAFTKRE